MPSLFHDLIIIVCMKMEKVRIVLMNNINPTK